MEEPDRPKRSTFTVLLSTNQAGGSDVSPRCAPLPWSASGTSAERDGPLRGSATVSPESRP